MAANAVRSWSEMLESSYIIFTLHPYQSNLRARLTKTPKVYFYDSGLLCALLVLPALSSSHSRCLCGWLHVTEGLVARVQVASSRRELFHFSPWYLHACRKHLAAQACTDLICDEQPS